MKIPKKVAIGLTVAVGISVGALAASFTTYPDAVVGLPAAAGEVAGDSYTPLATPEPQTPGSYSDAPSPTDSAAPSTPAPVATAQSTPLSSTPVPTPFPTPLATLSPLPSPTPTMVPAPTVSPCPKCGGSPSFKSPNACPMVVCPQN